MNIPTWYQQLMAYIIALVAILLLYSCSEPLPPGVTSEHGYKWEHDPSADYCPNEYKWLQKPNPAVDTICGGPQFLGCVIVGSCTVVSRYSEDAARKLIITGTDQSHRDHEVEMHLRRQLRHPL